jgi:hypothetical protein
MKRGFPRFRSGRVLVLGLIGLLPAALGAQSAIPRPDCCALIHDTGRWLGWAAALLEYTRDAEAPTPADPDIVRCLRAAGENAQRAFSACSSGVPAWSDWRQKQLQIDGLISELSRLSDPVKSHKTRRQLIASYVNTAYNQWAEDLSFVKMDGQWLRQKTCATCFFQVGFDLADATQAFRQALEAYAGQNMRSALHQLNQTRLQLKRVLSVIDAYKAVRRPRIREDGCPPLVDEATERRLRGMSLEAPSMVRAKEELQFVSDCSDDIGRSLALNCVAGGLRPAVPAADPVRPAPADPGGAGGLYVGTNVRLNALRRSQGYPVDVPVMVIERTGPRTYRLVRSFDRDFQTGRFAWREGQSGNIIEVFGDWLCQSFPFQAGGRTQVSRVWQPRLRPEWVAQLREIRIGVGDHLLAPNLPDRFSPYDTPAHCSGDDPACSGDIAGYWLHSGGWCYRIELKKD